MENEHEKQLTENNEIEIGENKEKSEKSMLRLCGELFGFFK